MSTDKESSGGFTICLSKVRKGIIDVYPGDTDIKIFSGIYEFGITGRGGAYLSIPKKGSVMQPVLRIFIPGCDAPFKTVNLNHCREYIINKRIAKEFIQAYE